MCKENEKYEKMEKLANYVIYYNVCV
jgi:hypothetical protein